MTDGAECGFASDGCSGGLSRAWRCVLGTAPPWEGCCFAHDLDYWNGGSAADRRRADARLLACVALKGHPVWAVVMWAAVRVGGHPLLPTPWRWGMARPYGCGYTGRAS